ncbi:MAG TPA: fibronectin type III domain-containing protein, partial [Cyclobacteriaceae bacterium]|nr:fibronectin type III domain-containing protein [Cyclobacteriaceae bacterium]
MKPIWNGGDSYEMNYRLLFPKNYDSNPNFPDGYPLIIMTHGLGEVGNCANETNPGSCYFPNQNWNPSKVSIESRNFVPKIYNITSVESVNSTTVKVTTSELHNFLNSQTVNISGSSISAYNGDKSISSVTAYTFNFQISNGQYSGTTTASVRNNTHAQFQITGGQFIKTGVFNTGDLIFVRGNPSSLNSLRRIIRLNDTTFKLSNNLTWNAGQTTNILTYAQAPFTDGTLERYIPRVFSITSVSDNSGIALFTTNEPHQFVVGGPVRSNQVLISGSSVASYNLSNYVGNNYQTYFKILSTPTPTTFTMAIPVKNGNNWNDVTITYAGNTTTALAAQPTTTQQLLNNDHSMVHGGAVHQTAVNAVPTGMTPDDPALPARSFPGFVLFPQNMNTWSTTRLEDSKVILIVRLLMKKYNIDPNRIYVHGLSDGGAGAYRLTRSAPWLITSVLPMSAVNNAQITDFQLFPYIRTIPIWTFQGGVDGNPSPGLTTSFISQYQNQGMSVRYTLYPNLGHGTWNAAYAEPDFFTWMLSKNKSDIFVRYGKTEICGTTGDGVILELAQGFHAYQWELDGEIIAGATTYLDTAKVPGTYRARFSRVPNPTENDWNRWSKPVTITESSPVKPVIAASGTQVFPTINGNGVENSVKLSASEKADRYYWYYGGNTNPIVHPGVNTNYQDTVSSITRAGGSNPGYYTLKTADFGNCPSPLSDPEYYVWNATINITAPGNFAGQATSYSTIFLSWTDNSNNEKGFEVWRRKAGETIFKFVVRTAEDAVSFEDTGLEPNTTYQYKLRAVSNTGRSDHAPATNLVVNTPADPNIPTAPQNLAVTANDTENITLAWTASTDDSGIRQYWVYYGADSVNTNSTQTSFTITDLTLNSVYPITVRAEDLGGNLSEHSNQVIGNTYVQGLFYGHSTGAWTYIDPGLSAGAEDTPPMQWHTFEFYGSIPNPNFNLHIQPSNLGTGGLATQSDFYNFKFDGFIDVPDNSLIASSPALTQTYQFRTTSDDGSMLFIDGFNPYDLTEYLKVDNDGLHGNVTVQSGDVTLSPGPHRIVILYFERTGSQSLTVQYRVKRVGPNNYTAWANIPKTSGGNNPSDLPLRSGNYIPPTPPVAATDLDATATGMTSIDLTWEYGGAGTDEFEIYRATELNGEYAVIHRTNNQSYTDNTGLIPGTTYYYKLKTVNGNGSSAFSMVDSDQTFPDTMAPSVPSFLTLASETYTNVAFTWTASTDNVGVTGYEILIDGVVTDTTASTSYMAMNLNPGTLYNFTVKAFDASHNKSAPSDALVVTTNMGQVFYSKDEGNLSSSSTWGTETDGSGTTPNFNLNGQIYQINNRTT